MAKDDPMRDWAQPDTASSPEAAAARLEQALDRIAAMARQVHAEHDRLTSMPHDGVSGYDTAPLAHRLDRLIAQLRSALAVPGDAPPANLP